MTFLEQEMTYFRENVEKAKGYEPGFQPQASSIEYRLSADLSGVAQAKSEASAKAEASSIVKLNTNENPWPPSPQVTKVLTQISAERLRRYPDPQANEFRQATADVIGVPADYIMCCNGGDELLNIAFRAFCDQDRPVAYPVPTYSLFPVLAKLQNCKAIEIPFDSEFNLPAKLAGTNAALTIVCNPNAPSGTFINVEELASLADEVSGVLLIDEAYVDFAEANCTALVKNFDNVLILRSLSKGYSLAGLRFGYAIAQPDLIAGLMKVKDSYNVDAIAIAIATAAIKDQKYFKENVERVKAERARVTIQLRKLGFDVPDSQSNFILAKCKNCKADQVYEKLLQRNIYIRYFAHPGLEDKLRITIGTPEQSDRLISALEDILQISESRSVGI